MEEAAGQFLRFCRSEMWNQIIVLWFSQEKRQKNKLIYSRDVFEVLKPRFLKKNYFFPSIPVSIRDFNYYIRVHKAPSWSFIKVSNLIFLYLICISVDLATFFLLVLKTIFGFNTHCIIEDVSFLQYFAFIATFSYFFYSGKSFAKHCDTLSTASSFKKNIIGYYYCN